MMSQVQKMFITETSATVYKDITLDTKTWPVIETWTKHTVKRLYYQDISKMDTSIAGVITTHVVSSQVALWWC